MAVSSCWPVTTWRVTFALAGRAMLYSESGRSLCDNTETMETVLTYDGFAANNRGDSILVEKDGYFSLSISLLSCTTTLLLS